MPSIYIDSCCFIDLLKGSAGIAVEEWRQTEINYTESIIEASRDGALKAFTSFLTFAECTHVKDEEQRQVVTDEVKDRIEGLLLSANSGIIPVEPSFFVLERIRTLAWNHHIYLGGFDGLHVGSALEAECVELLTYDENIRAENRRLILEATSLRLCKPSETTLLPDKYKQGRLNYAPEEE